MAGCTASPSSGVLVTLHNRGGSAVATGEWPERVAKVPLRRVQPSWGATMLGAEAAASDSECSVADREHGDSESYTER